MLCCVRRGQSWHQQTTPSLLMDTLTKHQCQPGLWRGSPTLTPVSIPTQCLESVPALCPLLAAPQETPVHEDLPLLAIKTPHAFYPTAAAGGEHCREGREEAACAQLLAELHVQGVPGGQGCLESMW